MPLPVISNLQLLFCMQKERYIIICLCFKITNLIFDKIYNIKLYKYLFVCVCTLIYIICITIVDVPCPVLSKYFSVLIMCAREQISYSGYCKEENIEVACEYETHNKRRKRRRQRCTYMQKRVVLCETR